MVTLPLEFHLKEFQYEGSVSLTTGNMKPYRYILSQTDIKSSKSVDHFSSPYLHLPGWICFWQHRLICLKNNSESYRWIEMELSGNVVNSARDR